MGKALQQGHTPLRCPFIATNDDIDNQTTIFSTVRRQVGPGLPCALLGLSGDALWADRSLFGRILETFVYQELRRLKYISRASSSASSHMIACSALLLRGMVDGCTSPHWSAVHPGVAAPFGELNPPSILPKTRHLCSAPSRKSATTGTQDVEQGASARMSCQKIHCLSG
ncbi:hypothetical protein SAMN05660653_01707 [Desulfonatronum thiosulfatophilum]|uniref:Uncharacterized protein n=1 Tax=Desulfonatronum thiosulfatophilum TaxID=617002 RepID=A0A1G6CTK5_9BACT|nr:hypothetical protein SAMN05660653_01707 [Desulfonatronum thiosulfatophilum]